MNDFDVQNAYGTVCVRSWRGGLRRSRVEIDRGKTFFRTFQGKTAFGALGPISVSAARRRLKAGAAEAPQGRRGQSQQSRLSA